MGNYRAGSSPRWGGSLLLCALLSLTACSRGIPSPLAAMQVKGECQVLRSFDAPGGLTGWVVDTKKTKSPNRYIIVYSTHDGRYVLSGVLEGVDGANLSKTYYDEYAPKPDVETAAEEIQHDPHLINEGAASAPQIFVFSDPNCIFCNRIWHDFRPYIDGGRIRVSWALVDILKSSSSPRAAAILQAGDPAKALSLDETNFDASKEEGGIPALKHIPPELKAVLSHDNDVMANANGYGTPTILYRKSHEWHVLYGLPQDLNRFVSELDSPSPTLSSAQPTVSGHH